MSATPSMKRVNVKSVTPHLVVRDASEAIAFYQKAFGAVENPQESGARRREMMFAEDRHRRRTGLSE